MRRYSWEGWQQPVRQERRNRDQESFLIEMRTLSGYSGSPVIVHYVTVGTRAEAGQEPDGVALASLITNKAWLLGVDWGFVPAPPTLLDNRLDRTRLNSGMSAVMPAWKLSELPDRKEFAEAREQRDNETKELIERAGAATEADIRGKRAY